MSTPPVKSFGHRTWTQSPSRPGRAVANPPRTTVAVDLPPNLSPDLIASVVRGSGPRPAASMSHAAVTSVRWSVRAAVLAGLIVGLFNAAARATTFLSFGGLAGADKLPLENTLLNQFAPDALAHATLGQATLPIAVLVAMAGLWSGARASAFALLFAHKILARLGQTNLITYSLAGAAASLAYALIAGLLWAETTPLSIALETLSGLGAGFFYRLFAPTERG